MERRPAFFFSPTSSMSSSGDLSHSLPKGALFSPFSPMDTSLNSSGEAQQDRENFRYNSMYQYSTCVVHAVGDCISLLFKKKNVLCRTWVAAMYLLGPLFQCTRL